MATEHLAVQGPRVRLRPPRTSDMPLIQTLGADAVPARAGDTEEVAVICSAGDGAPIGILRYRIGRHQDNWAAIDWVALAEGARRWGFGADAVLLFEEEACRRWGIRRFRTEVDGRQGLSLYFWLRLGYRPAEYRREQEGTEAIAMVRDVETP